MLALNSPLYYKLAITADMAYRGYYDAAFFAAAAEQKRVIAPWCDCRPSPEGTPPSVAIQWMHELGLPFWIGQGESAAEFQAALTAAIPARLAFVNLSALPYAQLQTIKARQILVINELYRNCNASELPDWRNVNEGVGGNLIAVYHDGQCSGMPLSQYIKDGLFVPHQDSVYGPGMTAEDYKALP